jgi:hypothetical protein
MLTVSIEMKMVSKLVAEAIQNMPTVVAVIRIKYSPTLRPASSSEDIERKTTITMLPRKINLKNRAKGSITIILLNKPFAGSEYCAKTAISAKMLPTNATMPSHGVCSRLIAISITINTSITPTRISSGTK